MSRAPQLFNIAGVGDALAVFGQSVTKDVGHQSHVDFFTDGAHGLGRLANIASCADEFWVSIADRVFTNASFLYFVDERSASKLVVDDSGVTSQHVNGETHTNTR